MEIVSPAPGPIVVLSASIGAGHDGAAAEITRRLRTSGCAVRRADYLDLLPAGWGRALKQTYARQLAYAPASWGWLLDSAARPRGTRSAAWFATWAAQRRLLDVTGPNPAAVISTYPLASQALGRLRLAGHLNAPAFAVLTDPAVHPLCVAPGIDLHLAPNHEAAEVVRTLYGLAAATHTPIVEPAFRPARDNDEVATARRRHGLPLDAALALVVAGSWGVGDVDATVRDLEAATEAIPVVVCGRNTRLRDRLAAGGRAIALGWIDDMPSLLRAADVVVHNAGGLSSLEALASGIPLISYRCLPGHGVANAAALERLGLSAWPRRPEELAPALAGASRARSIDGPASSACTTDVAELIRRQIAGMNPVAVTALTGPATTEPATAMPATTVPATTVPATTVPATTVPATTVPATAEPASAAGMPA
ncbi:glycosyltransferase [Actinoplanes sp. NPDC051411]|uniref:glycosyltransferase n=1 Tax=Actinoplanes sp. NPDC051411 TaxID=3155522 RepID=UPI0034420C09